MNKMNNVEVFGSLILGYSEACKNLHIIACGHALKLMKDIKFNGWYPLNTFLELEKIITTNYYDPRPIMEKIGFNMMSNWYHNGPGKNIIKTGVDFINFQTGSQGYRNVVKGSPLIIGDFKLESINENRGIAIVKSTTPFNRDMERGVLYGGISAPDDIGHLVIKNDEDIDTFKIKFF